MLYVTTREKHDAYTATKALKEDRGPDGGLYLPFNLPRLDTAQLAALGAEGFGATAAQILNLFFSCRLTGWEVEMCVGKRPVCIAALNPKTFAAETYHNIEWDYQHLENALFRLVSQRMELSGRCTSWFRIAIRIAVVFALYGEMLKTGTLEAGQSFDASVPTGDFTAPMALWYAREMGLPVANIICACNENNAVWDLIHLGQLRTDTPAVKTATPLVDVGVPDELERLIFGVFGIDEVRRYSQIAAMGGQYLLTPEALDKLRKGLFAAVVSSDRVSSLMPSAYSTWGYIMGPYTVLAYGALMDYRAKTGESRPAVFLADRCAVCDGAFVSDALNITEAELKEQIEMS